MQILHKRQTGASETPESLAYGEIAIDKRGYLHTADEDGGAVDPLTPAMSVISNTQYDVKMLQLESILEEKEPPMLGGFIEGFGDTRKRQTASKCTVDTAAHTLTFDGDNAVNATKTFSTNSQLGSTYQLDTVTGVISAAAAVGTVTEVRFEVEISWVYPEVGDFTGNIYGLTSPQDAGTLLGGTVYTDDFTAGVKVSSPQKYPYYKGVITNNGPRAMPGSPTGKGDFESMSSDSSGVYPSAWARLSYYQAATETVDGYYVTKVVDLGVPVEEGEVYLHYKALPEGATLTPKVGGATSGQTALETEGEERTVTVNGETLRERKYRIPPFAEAVSGVSVRVDGHREALGDELVLCDICVVMR